MTATAIRFRSQVRLIGQPADAMRVHVEVTASAPLLPDGTATVEIVSVHTCGRRGASGPNLLDAISWLDVLGLEAEALPLLQDVGMIARDGPERDRAAWAGHAERRKVEGR